ncbi:MAG: hypothetical protein ABSB67_17295, partial [Bryobacteraceae bacterium]
ANLPLTGEEFCDATHREELDSFFRDRVKSYSGGTRNLRNTIESINDCIARKKALGPNFAEFLKGY